MKTKLLTALFISMCCFTTQAQTPEDVTTETATVEKSLFSVQTGFIGLWVSNESRLSNRWALRTEVGFDLWTYKTYENYNLGEEKKGSFLAPSITIEPRWYYNIEKRGRKGRYTGHNSANFATISVKYFPDAFTIGSHPDFINIPNQITITPKWGIRRSIAQSNFNYELAFGIGYMGYLSKEHENINENSDVYADVHVRIGYTF